jgi:hypothetical protein
MTYTGFTLDSSTPSRRFIMHSVSQPSHDLGSRPFLLGSLRLYQYPPRFSQTESSIAMAVPRADRDALGAQHLAVWPLPLGHPAAD